MTQRCSFCLGFEKVATTAGSVVAGKASKIFGMKPETAHKVYYGLEQGGLAALGATDAYDAYKAHKAGHKGERNKALINTGALGGLMAATHLAHKMGH